MAPSISDLSAVTASDLSALENDGQRYVRLESWLLEGAREAVVALANSDGGLVVVGLADGQDEATLDAAGRGVEPNGARLVRTRVLDTPSGRIGLIAVDECADPPALVASSGAIYRRDGNATRPVLGRAALDELLTKRERLRARATRALDAQVERIAFGHGSYYSLAVVFQPLLADKRSVEWARSHHADLLTSAMVKRWNLGAADVNVEGATFEIRRQDDETGFVTVGSNGAVAVGVRAKRPALERFVSPAELAEWIGEFVEVVRLVQSGGEGGLGVPSLFFEGLREFRLEGTNGYGPPCTKDLERELLSPRYLRSDDDRDIAAVDMLASLGEVFGADFSAGTVAVFDGAVDGGPSRKTWHGKTLRTERRMAGSRGFGSSR
jgi:hypothetical protein